MTQSAERTQIPMGAVLAPAEVVQVLERDGWSGPSLGTWHKQIGEVIWEARTVVFRDGNAGLSVQLAHRGA